MRRKGRGVEEGSVRFGRERGKREREGGSVFYRRY